MLRRPNPYEIVLLAALLAGTSYLAADSLTLPQLTAVIWKGAGVGLLAVYAALKARDRDGWLITVVMAFGTLGDVLIETNGLIPGAMAFLAGHLCAIALYWRNRRPNPGSSQRVLAGLMIPAIAVTAYMLPADASSAVGIAVYSCGLALMASTAWLSRFSRLEVGRGALMFVASDLLIFARSGPLANAPWISLAIWVLYFFGQVLICTGVTKSLAATQAA